MESPYHGIFEDFIDVLDEFGINDEEHLSLLKRCNIIFADYVIEEDEGEAFVLFENGGNIYEVHAFHCNCDGLLGQWDPEEVDPTSFIKRINNSRILQEHLDFISKALSNIPWRKPWEQIV